MFHFIVQHALCAIIGLLVVVNCGVGFYIRGLVRDLPNRMEAFPAAFSEARKYCLAGGRNVPSDNKLKFAARKFANAYAATERKKPIAALIELREACGALVAARVSKDDCVAGAKAVELLKAQTLQSDEVEVC